MFSLIITKYQITFKKWSTLWTALSTLGRIGIISPLNITGGGHQESVTVDPKVGPWQLEAPHSFLHPGTCPLSAFPSVEAGSKDAIVKDLPDGAYDQTPLRPLCTL